MWATPAHCRRRRSRTDGLSTRRQLREGDSGVLDKHLNDGLLTCGELFVAGELVRLLDGLFQPEAAGDVVLTATNSPEPGAVFLDGKGPAHRRSPIEKVHPGSSVPPDSFDVGVA